MARISIKPKRSIKKQDADQSQTEKRETLRRVIKRQQLNQPKSEPKSAEQLKTEMDKLNIERLKRYIELIDNDIKRRQMGIQMELKGIASNKSLSLAEKMIERGRAMQRDIVPSDKITLILKITELIDKSICDVFFTEKEEQPK